METWKVVSESVSDGTKNKEEHDENDDEDKWTSSSNDTTLFFCTAGSVVGAEVWAWWIGTNSIGAICVWNDNVLGLSKGSEGEEQCGENVGLHLLNYF